MQREAGLLVAAMSRFEGQLVNCDKMAGAWGLAVQIPMPVDHDPQEPSLKRAIAAPKMAFGNGPFQRILHQIVRPFTVTYQSSRKAPKRRDRGFDVFQNVHEADFLSAVWVRDERYARHHSHHRL